MHIRSPSEDTFDTLYWDDLYKKPIFICRQIQNCYQKYP